MQKHYVRDRGTQMTRAPRHTEGITTMATTLQRGSATIYQFPARGRFAAGADRREEAPSNLIALRAPNTVSGSGWYHDEAIEDAERVRKN